MLPDHEIGAALDQVFRQSRPRLLAFLAARAGGDLTAAEDALSDAFAAALDQWSHSGIPRQPEAWLISVAKRRLIDAQRRGATRLAAMDRLSQALEAASAVVDAPGEIPDERLKLFFVCAHPAIDPAVRAPLILQTILGLEAQQIAGLFLLTPAAMSQRLVRAKTKIRVAAIPFAVPPKEELAGRLDAVLDALYAAFTLSVDQGASSLAQEVTWLTQILVHLLPHEPETLGLLALMLFVTSRAPARRSPDGRFISLPDQDPRLWDDALASSAEALLFRAARGKQPGRYQLEAAIQAVHAARRRTGRIEWDAICALYAQLTALTASVGARVAWALALLEAGHHASSERLLRSLDAALLRDHQPYWAACARIQEALGQSSEALAAYRRAASLAVDPATKQWLEDRARRLEKEVP